MRKETITGIPYQLTLQNMQNNKSISTNYRLHTIITSNPSKQINNAQSNAYKFKLSRKQIITIIFHIFTISTRKQPHSTRTR